jgi:hypothetical protein
MCETTASGRRLHGFLSRAQRSAVCFPASGAACSSSTKSVAAAHFSDRGRLFQADRGRRFSAIVDARGLRASEVFNVSQSSTISLKSGVDGPMSMRP